ncbi:hypothetical protein SAMN04488057_106201 [Cyclobacterium lianum]|uniref:YceI-like domain-containing protein n=1 Tax=Cyclobacterium lianum TaxID=388280 RepID=A0A1M7P112_9BACT|nr:hypothetical protein [Cyclobacterium lianum]SHN09637.1 hypothetical protein SAMN04488057_106201 [Cyclobacterium lianum]
MRIASLLICSLLWMGSLQKETLVIQQKEIIVKGKTSIGDFECSYDKEQIGDTLFIGPMNTTARSLNFTIPVREFGCGNFILNGDFRRTLKADQYPVCEVRVLRLFKGQSNLYGDLSIKLAGKRLMLDKVMFDKSQYLLAGKVQLSFEELELETPSRLGGLVSVEENIDLEIKLYTGPG